MPITYPLLFPTIIGPASVVMRTHSAVAISRSPFTFATQIQVHQGTAWGATVNLPAMARARAEEWVAFLVKLNGREGTFLMGDPSGATPRGSASSTPGSPVIDGAGQTGSDLNLRGLPVSASDYLLAGDYFQTSSGLNPFLYKVLDDVSTDSAGEATVILWPDLRGIGLGDGAAVVVQNTSGRFRLVKNTTEWSIDEAVHFGITFDAIEAL